MIDRVYATVLEHVKTCESMINLGANIGLASIFLASHYNCPVFAVEPNPSTYSVLTRNLDAARGEVALLGAVWSQPARLGDSGRAMAHQYSRFEIIESEGRERFPACR